MYEFDDLTMKVLMELIDRYYSYGYQFLFWGYTCRPN